ncbi:MAG: hypothetical protein ABSC03_11650 [Verrucomicrobiota bacterium]
MRLMRTLMIGLPLLAALAVGHRSTLLADTPPVITSFTKPVAGDMEILFRATGGPFLIQKRDSLDASSPWNDLPDAIVTQIQPGVFSALVTSPPDTVNLSFYRILSVTEPMTELHGWTVLLRVSAPANGSYFVAGEAPVVTVNLLDTLAQGVVRTNLATLALYMDGPKDPMQTVTAAKLLNATTNRALTPHHYINLLNNTNVQINGDGNALVYPLQPVSTEAPGTYTVAVRAVLASDALQQTVKFVTVQIGTTNVEQDVVTKVQCGACHLGPVSGMVYMHHIWPSATSPGSWSLDYTPVTSCKECHNNDGYSAYTDASGNKVPDPIVRRVHGVHMGSQLQLPFNINSTNGDFAPFRFVEFPADVRNCTACHADDRWKTQPSRLACGACHDNTWFGAKASLPAGQVLHPGGPQATDSVCSMCHFPDATPDEPFDSIAENHYVAPPTFNNLVNLQLSTPANGLFYQPGESPTVTIEVMNTNGVAINPTNIVEPLVSTNVQPNEWRRANLMVAGPRALTVPVLTTAAATKPATTYANNDFRVRVNPANNDPRVTRTATAVIYQLADVSNVVSGTYTVYVEIQGAISTNLGATVFTNFQVGSTNIEARVAANCTDCHGANFMHADNHAVPFDPELCKVCHDYLHQMSGKTNWSNSQWGFGNAPLSRRVHGVHYGNYLDHPDQITSGTNYWHLIFPQDVRNCTKCHSTSPAWTQNPSRLACNACHDTDAAVAHADLMTWEINPLDPWSGSETETCDVCHGAGAEFSPDKVHAIANPYVPPYMRALRTP